MSEPINDTWFRRKITLLSIKLLKRVRPRIGCVLFLTPNICVKYGNTVHMCEAAALKLVGESTSITVPKLYCAFARKGMTYIVMERLRGEDIGSGWNRRTAESRADLMSQLRQCFAQLRAIPHPVPGMVASADMKSLHDYRISPEAFGPFANSREFHAFLRNGIGSSEKILPEVGQLIQMQEKNQCPVCFSHGDPSSSNLLVVAGKVAMVDFEFSGFKPSYWDYVAGKNVNPYDGFWKDEIDKFLDPYPNELEMERLRLKYFGPY